MGNKAEKQRIKLEARRVGFDAIPIEKRRGFKRPGSQNAKKQISSGMAKRVGRR